MKKAEVLSINVSPVMGAEMESRQQVTALKDRGLAGDRYENGSGAFSKSPRENVPLELNQDRKVIRDVTLIANEAIRVANAEHQTNFTFTDTRRNILVEGIEDLRTLIGVVFKLGGVAMFGIEACDPCDRPSKLASKPGFKEAFDQRGGLRARVLEDGEIAVGDALMVEDAPPAPFSVVRQGTEYFLYAMQKGKKTVYFFSSEKNHQSGAVHIFELPPAYELNAIGYPTLVVKK